MLGGTCLAAWATSYALAFSSLELSASDPFVWLKEHVPFFAALDRAHRAHVIPAQWLTGVTALYGLGFTACVCVVLLRLVSEVREGLRFRAEERVIWALVVGLLLSLYYLSSVRIRANDMTAFSTQQGLFFNMLKITKAIWLLFWCLGELLAFARGYIVDRYGAPTPGRSDPP
jgi:hypothetical protein